MNPKPFGTPIPSSLPLMSRSKCHAQNYFPPTNDYFPTTTFLRGGPPRTTVMLIAKQSKDDEIQSMSPGLQQYRTGTQRTVKATMIRRAEAGRATPRSLSFEKNDGHIIPPTYNRNPYDILARYITRKTMWDRLDERLGTTTPRKTLLPLPQNRRT